MASSFSRICLASSVSCLLAFGADAQSVITVAGGGGSLGAMDYAGPLVWASPIPSEPSEEATANCLILGDCQSGFEYYVSSSGSGQSAFSMDNPTVLWQSVAYAARPPFPSFVAYAGSDAYLHGSAGQTIDGFTYTNVAGIPGLTADYPLRQSQDGALIQIPMLGAGVAVATLVGGKSQVLMGDDDLCGIFSGLITDYSKLSHPVQGGMSLSIHVYYSARSGGSFLFTNHLKAVCKPAGIPSSNSNFPAAGLAAAPTDTFAAMFAGQRVPGNFIAEPNELDVAIALAGDDLGIGFLGPDLTAATQTGKPNSGYATLPVVALLGRGGSAFLLPTIGNIVLGLAHPGTGSTHIKPPTGPSANNPLSWIPSIPLVASGYPIVGYTTWEMAQCYADPKVADLLIAFLTARLTHQQPYSTDITEGGFTLPLAAYQNAIIKNFLTPTSALAIASAGSPGTCRSVSGR